MTAQLSFWLDTYPSIDPSDVEGYPFELRAPSCHCDGSVHCPVCSSSAESGRNILAREAARLWRRDLGRGAKHGTASLYIGFAVDSALEGELPGIRLAEDE